MYISSNGIVTDERGHVLLTLRGDPAVWTLPGGHQMGVELPPQTAVRDIEEQTQLKTLPVRLVGLYHVVEPPRTRLAFVFRCLVRGGEATTSEKVLAVRYAGTNDSFAGMTATHRERLDRGRYHSTIAPYWGEQRLGLRERWARRSLVSSPDLSPAWSVQVAVLGTNDIAAERDNMALVDSPDQMPPWSVAGELAKSVGLAMPLLHLGAVYTDTTALRVTLIFVADGAVIATAIAPAGARLAETALARQARADAKSVDIATQFRRWPPHDAPP